MDCPKIPQLKYTDFSGSFYSKKTASKRIPINGAIELTMRCNLTCAHCYCAVDKNKKELTTPQWKNIIDQIVDAGCLWLLITGGEPLLRPDFLELYLYAKSRGLLITIFTNGTLIDDYLAKTLAENKPFRMEITVYGSNKDIYDRVCGIDTYEKFRIGIHLLEENNIEYQLKTLVTKDNIGDFAKIMAFMQKDGKTGRFDGLISPKINGDASATTKRLDADALAKLEMEKEKIRNVWKEFIENDHLEHNENSKALICSAGINDFNISPYGQLQFCLALREPYYDLHNGSFKEGWEIYLLEQREKFPAVDQKCWDCDMVNFCESCPGWSWLEYGNYSEPSEFLCNLAKKRAEGYFIDSN